MQRSHYALQALLYAVALHRFLRWRLRGYDPARNLGGIHYLFLRGMLGAAGPLAGVAATGVFDWHPPAGLIVELSEVARWPLARMTVTRAARRRSSSHSGPLDPLAPAQALRAPEPLATFNRAGVLEAADVHVTRTLAQLAGVHDGDVLLAVALAVRAPRRGHVFVDLERIAATAEVERVREQRGEGGASDAAVSEPVSLPWPEPAAWTAAVSAATTLVGPERPLRLEGSRLYLDRDWRRAARRRRHHRGDERRGSARHRPRVRGRPAGAAAADRPGDRRRQPARAARRQPDRRQPPRPRRHPCAGRLLAALRAPGRRRCARHRRSRGARRASASSPSAIDNPVDHRRRPRRVQRQLPRRADRLRARLPRDRHRRRRLDQPSGAPIASWTPTATSGCRRSSPTTPASIRG